MSAKYDVAVIGAGFAGLACARQLARRGLRVVVLDRQRAPGDRIRTTGILVKEAQDEWAAPNHLTRKIKRVRIYAPSHRSLALERDDYFFLATDTQQLLERLAGETRASGAEIQFGQSFAGATAQDGYLTLKGSGLKCRFLVGADGARSQVAKSFGLDRNENYLKGVEYAFEPLEGVEESLHCFIDPARAPGYIGWVLPGVGMAQIGLACQSTHSADLPGFIDSINPLFHLSRSSILDKRGGIIPIGGLLKNFYNENVLLVGDAAGMVSPLTAGGIHRAYQYGRLAGDAIADHLLDRGPHPGEVVRNAYPRRAWQHAARWMFDQLPVSPALEVALRFPRLFKSVAGKVFFNRMR